MSERYDESMILAYVEQLLSPEDRLAFENLLDQDPALKMLMQQLIEDRRHLASMPIEPAPADLMDRVNHQLERQMLLDSPMNGPEVTTPRKRQNLGRWMVYSSVAAMLVVTLGTVFVIFRETLRLPSQSSAPTALSSLPAPADSMDGTVNHRSEASAVPSAPASAMTPIASPPADKAKTGLTDVSAASSSSTETLALAKRERGSVHANEETLATGNQVVAENGDRVAHGRFKQEARVSGLAAMAEHESPVDPTAWPKVYIQVMTDDLAASQNALLAWAESLNVAVTMEPKRSEPIQSLRQQAVSPADPLWNIQESRQSQYPYQNQNALPTNQANASATVTYRSIRLTIAANQVPRLLNHLNARLGQNARVICSSLSMPAAAAATSPSSNSSSLGMTAQEWAGLLLAPLARQESTPVWESSQPLLLPVILVGSPSSPSAP